MPSGLQDASEEALIAVLQASPKYTDYVKLLQLGDVADDLATGDALTVFAPGNEAVAAKAALLNRYLEPETLKSALAAMEKGSLPEIDDPENLGNLLKRGIIAGELAPNLLRPGMRLRPLEGEDLSLEASGADFSVGGVRFDAGSGTLAANGVLYQASGLIGP